MFLSDTDKSIGEGECETIL